MCRTDHQMLGELGVGRSEPLHGPLPAPYGRLRLVRKATAEDVLAVARLVAYYAGLGEILPRSVAEIARSIDAWVVAEEDGRIVGCGSLVLMSPELAEIRSLVVAPQHQRNGLGRRIVRQLLAEAQRRGVVRVFALTRVVPFFAKLGFSMAPRTSFPDKIWKDCARCPLQATCDEVAVELDLIRVEERPMPAT